MIVRSILLVAAALAPTTLAGMYGQPVVHLDSKSFKKVMATEHASMVAFVAPWCGHCKNLGPEYTAAAQSLTPLIPFYAVDCDDAANKPLCAEYQVQGFPTIKAFPRAGKGAARDYNGERKKGALVEYAKSLVPDRVKKLRVDEGVETVLSKFLEEKSDLPHALLVHPSTPSIPFLWKVLGHRFSSKAHLGYIRDTPSHEVLASLGLFDPADTSRDGARAVVWEAGASKPHLVEYQGVLKFNGLLEWLQAIVDGVPPPPVEKPTVTPKSETAAGTTSEDRQRRLAKLEEAERRDRLRREKAAAATPSPAEAPDATPEAHSRREPADEL